MKKFVSALRFLPEIDSAPRIIAMGEGRLGEEIERLARENGIEVQKNPELAESLSYLGLGDEIPDNLYKAVAVLFQYLWEKDPAKKSF